jgi:UDP-N-acetylmuramoylalanine--D-glutamate ligase
VAGNIGPTLLDVLRQHWQGGTLPQAWVLELSSFQLDGVQGFEPTAATVLNVTQDHLDWHGSMEAYAAAKARIFGQQGVLVLNRDDATVMAWQPQPHTVRENGRHKTLPARAHTTFGTGVPTQADAWGLETVNGMTWLVRAQPADDAPATPARRSAAAPAPELHLQRLMPAEALRIRGRHNASNALAALALATAAGAPLAPMLHALRDYRGEPHRVEPVAIVHEVEYFDDSKGTNVGATLAALNGLGPERRLVVILGGDGKGQDFAPLAPAVARHVRAVALIGRDAPAIRAALASTGVPLHDAPDLPAAVQWCAQQARAGDAVLLSPACASLDMFKDYAHRAQVFVDEVRALQEAAGSPA